VGLISTAQAVFRTLLKKGPVVVGESFQIQFVLEDIDRNAELYPPDLRDFRLIRGPEIHTGTIEGPDGPKKMKNFVYTLEAIVPGKFALRGASAKVEEHFIKSNDITIEVISKTEASKKNIAARLPDPNAAYFLRPGEDPYDKIRDNIFLRVVVDRKNCFVGEPVTATFKLYSRLVSRSDIVKNPGFYGFTVQDIVGLYDKQSSTELVDGKNFDVHTVRKVQLYPLRAGSFTIDPMEVLNKVEFSRTIVNKKAEQEIEEGIYADKRVATANTESYESSMSTKPVGITVKATPVKNKPVDFTGATGHFSIKANLDRTAFKKNEEGELTITVSGSGNFTQLTAPVIEWPDSLESFEPKITDALDHHHSPMKGVRTFRFAFISSRPGHYTIPAIGFSYFDPDSNHYKTVATTPLTVEVKNEEKIPAGKQDLNKSVFKPGYAIIFWSVILAVVTIVAMLLIRRRKKRTAADILPVGHNSLPTVAEILAPAHLVLEKDSKSFYTTLRACTWNFLGPHFGLKGSAMNRQSLVAAMEEKKVDKKEQANIIDLLQQFETGIFADVNIEVDRKELLASTMLTIESIGNRQ
jgi:hypothetical protein